LAKGREEGNYFEQTAPNNATASSIQMGLKINVELSNSLAKPKGYSL